jgi:selenocysteine lyase/cysteine desulfurase
VTATESIANGHAVASLETIRAQFPALQRKYNGLPVAYFDGPGGTQVPTMVADSMRDYLLHHNANTHCSTRRQRTSSSATT